MNCRITLAAIGLAVMGCAPSQPTEAGDVAEENSAPVAAADADLSDGLITCAMPDFDGADGITVTEKFVLQDGAVKRYAGFQNVIFDLCQPGMEGCLLALDGGAIDMRYTSNSGVATRYRVNLAEMSIKAWRTEPGGAERAVVTGGGTCTRGPLPEGATTP